MRIVQPIGARLPSCELPSGSYVNAKIIHGADGLPNIMLTSSLAKPYIEIAVSDLETIKRWATGESPL